MQRNNEDTGAQRQKEKTEKLTVQACHDVLSGCPHCACVLCVTCVQHTQYACRCASCYSVHVLPCPCTLT